VLKTKACQRVALEQIPIEWNIARVGEILRAFLRRKAVEYVAEGIPQCGGGGSGDLSRKRFELGDILYVYRHNLAGTKPAAVGCG
jgi:hypothetical protein